MRSSAFQPGDRDTKLKSRLVPESSFLSNPPHPFVFSRAPIMASKCCWSHLDARARCKCTCVHVAFETSRVTRAGELGNRCPQTPALSSARDLRKCEAHRASGITAALGIGFLTAVLSPRALSPSVPVHLGWFRAVGTEAGDQSSTSDTLNKS